MLDYTDDSVVSIFTDNCDGQKTGGSTTNQGYSEHRGKNAIRAMFGNLFTQLKDNITQSNVKVTGAGSDDNPRVVEDTNGEIAAANVFLTWTADAATPVINWATDSFSFNKEGDKFRIHKQNIVLEEADASNCKASERVKTDGSTETITDLNTLNACKADNSTDLCKAWLNHFDAFGTHNIDNMMLDYSDASVIVVSDARGRTIETHDSTDKIKAMFNKLFDDLGRIQGDDPATRNPGLAVKLLEVDEATRTVFLVWVSDNIPQATDTFIFDSSSKIITQNIQVVSKAPGADADIFF